MFNKILFCTVFFAFYFLNVEYADSSISRAEKYRNHAIFYKNHVNKNRWNPIYSSFSYRKIKRNTKADPHFWVPKIYHQSRSQYTRYDGWQKWVPRNISHGMSGSGLRWSNNNSYNGISSLYVSQPQVTRGYGGIYKRGGYPNNAGMYNRNYNRNIVSYSRSSGGSNYQPLYNYRRPPSTAHYQPLYARRENFTQWRNNNVYYRKKRPFSCTINPNFFGHHRCMDRDDFYAYMNNENYNNGRIVMVR